MIKLFEENETRDVKNFKLLSRKKSCFVGMCLANRFCFLF